MKTPDSEVTTIRDVLDLAYRVKATDGTDTDRLGLYQRASHFLEQEFLRDVRASAQDLVDTHEEKLEDLDNVYDVIETLERHIEAEAEMSEWTMYVHRAQFLATQTDYAPEAWDMVTPDGLDDGIVDGLCRIAQQVYKLAVVESISSFWLPSTRIDDGEEE